MTRALLLGTIAASRRRGGATDIVGYDTKGSVQATAADAGRMYVSKFALASAGTLTELHGWFVASGGHAGNSARVVIYDDDGAGTLPGTRLAYTADTALPNGDTHLQEAGFSVALGAGDYWVGFIWKGPAPLAGGCYGETSGGTHQGITSGAAYTPPPDPFGTPNTSGARKHSCWGVVEL